MSVVLSPEIEELHRLACARGDAMYEDPTSGLSVFTERAHCERGYCCGSGCRHCPYGHAAVPNRLRPPTAVDGPRAVLWRWLVAAWAWAVECAKSMTRLLSGWVFLARAARTHRKSQLYTKKGDGGYTRLLAGDALSKYDAVCEAMGEVDELSAKLGLAAYHCQPRWPWHGGWRAAVVARLHASQLAMLDAGAVLASVGQTDEARRIGTAADAFSDEAVARLEADLDDLDAALPPLRNFVVPRGPVAALALHDARVVCRRAERRVWRVVHERDDARARQLAVFLNRFSDYIFAAARTAAHFAGPRRAEVSYDVTRARLQRPSVVPPNNS